MPSEQHSASSLFKALPVAGGLLITMNMECLQSIFTIFFSLRIVSKNNVLR